MKVIEHLANAQRDKKPIFSYEIIPPTRGKSSTEITEIVEKLLPYHPPFIDVTSHAATQVQEIQGDGTVKKKKVRKRPGTIGICGIIQNRFKIDTVAHILCQGFTREETEDALIELGYLGIHNVLALRGDEPNFKKIHDADRSENIYANDLVSQISDINNGKFIDGEDDGTSMNFCLGVAGYPEKHFEASSLKEDVKNLKKKIDAGGEYIVSQMFYDNKYFFDFAKECRSQEIQTPIIPGLKVLTSVKQLTSVPKNFHLDIPKELQEEVLANPKHVKEIGIKWTQQQCEELLNAGAPCIHFYIMNNPDPVIKIVNKLQK